MKRKVIDKKLQKLLRQEQLDPNSCCDDPERFSMLVEAENSLAIEFERELKLKGDVSVLKKR